MANEFVARLGLIARQDSQITGSLKVTGSLQITGSVTSATFGFTGSLLGTASYVSGNVHTSTNPALSASYTISSSRAELAGNASTIDINVFGADVESYVLISNVVGTSGVAVGSDADIRYNSSTNKLTVVNVSATNLTGSLLGTASYVTASSVYGPFGSNSVISSSYALSASYASTASFLLGGAGLKTKSSGSLASNFAGNPKISAITFTTAFTDNNYSVVITGEDARTWTIESKTSAGFTINSNSNVSPTGITYWTATAFGES